MNNDLVFSDHQILGLRNILRIKPVNSEIH